MNGQKALKNSLLTQLWVRRRAAGDMGCLHGLGSNHCLPWTTNDLYLMKPGFFQSGLFFNFILENEKKVLGQEITLPCYLIQREKVKKIKRLLIHHSQNPKTFKCFNKNPLCTV